MKIVTRPHPFALAALAVAPLVLAGCASSGKAAAAPPQAAPMATAPDHPANISPAHPYCMWVRETGQLSECYQFAFGRCEAWGGRCQTPGWMTPPAAGAGGDAGAPGSGAAP